MTIIMVLLFIMNGVVTMEQKAFKDMEACTAHAQTRIEALMASPGFDQGLYASCTASKLQEVQRIGEKFF